MKYTVMLTETSPDEPEGAGSLSSRKSVAFQVLLNVSFINSAQLFSYRCSAAAACFSCTSRGRYIKLNSVITLHRIAQSLGLMNSLQFS